MWAERIQREILRYLRIASRFRNFYYVYHTRTPISEARNPPSDTTNLNMECRGLSRFFLLEIVHNLTNIHTYSELSKTCFLNQ